MSLTPGEAQDNPYEVGHGPSGTVLGLPIEVKEREDLKVARHLTQKGMIQKVLWIYIMAFALVAFSFHSEAQEKTAENSSKETAEKPATKSAEESKKKTNEKGTVAEKSKKGSKDKKKDKQMLAEFETNQGTFKVKLFNDKTPVTVENFVSLAEGTKEWKDPKTGEMVKKPFYDGLTFHRVIKNFMIQGGDPKGDGTGGPGLKEFKDEFAPGLTHKKGVLSMANRGPNTNGSQFFITVGEPKHLDGKHTIFGEVVEGLDVVDKIATVPTGPSDRPVEPVVIKKLKIVRQ
jgi:peptidyl-prolyl cis-trans isomerase A (cyclophilin A)